MFVSILRSTRSHIISQFSTNLSRIQQKQQQQQRFRSTLFKNKYVSRKRRLQKAKVQFAAEDAEREDTVSEIIFGKPPKKPEGFKPEKRWPRTIEEWKGIIRIRLPQYWASYEGYMPWWEDKGTLERLMEKELKEQGLPIDNKLANALEFWEKKKAKAPQQVDNNLQLLKKEGAKALEKVKENTGIRTKEDLKIFAEDMLRLANDCLGEFMKGYRQGRDDEVEKMLNIYFQELDQAVHALPTYQRMKRRGRKPKRRKRSVD